MAVYINSTVLLFLSVIFIIKYIVKRRDNNATFYLLLAFPYICFSVFGYLNLISNQVIVIIVILTIVLSIVYAIQERRSKNKR